MITITPYTFFIAIYLAAVIGFFISHIFSAGIAKSLETELNMYLNFLRNKENEIKHLKNKIEFYKNRIET